MTLRLPVMLMIMNPEINGPQPNYGPAPTPIPDNPLGGSFNQNTKRNKIIVSVMIVVVVLSVIIGFLMITNKKDPNTENMKDVVAIHMEIERVSNKALASDTLGTDAANQAARAKLVASTHKTISTKILEEEYNGTISKDFGEQSVDPKNDEALEKGTLLNNLDEAYLDLLKELLAQAYIEIGEIENSDQVIAEELRKMAESNETIFDSLN